MRPTITTDAASKLLNDLLASFNPALVKMLKSSHTSGYLLERDTLFATMFHEWSTLQKDVSDTMEAVSSLDWSVAPFVEPGAQPTPKAQRVADTVSAALWQVSPQEPGTFAHGFLDLVGAMLDGLYRGASVHEIIWQRTAKLVYPAEYRQVPAQCYMWETRTGKRDRLLMVRDGMSYSTPEPFPEHKFIIALNTTGSDHPLYNSIYFSLLGYFLAAKHGLPWMQSYCERYSHPVRVFKVQSPEDIPRVQEALKSSEVLTDIFSLPDTEVEVHPIPAGASVPHEVLLRVAENACHQAILGQTLTSDTADNGGSRAQAEVHLGVQKAVVLKRAEYVARVLNRQLVPAIVAMNYGRTEGLPLPEIKFAMPDDGANVERADYWARVLSIPGIKVSREHVYESLRIPMPAEGDDVIGSSEPTTAPEEGDDDDDDDPPPDKPKGREREKTAEKSESVQSAKSESATRSAADTLATQAAAAWLEPSVAALYEWIREGLNLEQLSERVQHMKTNTTALATGLGDAFAAGLRPTADTLAAAHCNQHEHASGCLQGSEQASATADIAEKFAGIAPIEITFETEKKTGAEWVKDAQDYFMDHYAGRSFAIGNTGHILHVGTSKNRAKIATKGVNKQYRNEAFKNLQNVISHAVHLSSEEPIPKINQGHHKTAIIAKTSSFEKYGAPAIINGKEHIIWFNAQTKEKGAKDVLLYEFGVSSLQEKR